MTNETMTVTPNELRDILVDLLIDNTQEMYDKNNKGEGFDDIFEDLHHINEISKDIRTIQGYYTSLNDWAGLTTEEYKVLIKEMESNYDVIVDLDTKEN